MIVVLEGGEGAGKTTLANNLEEISKKTDVPVRRFKLPTPFIVNQFLARKWSPFQSQAIIFADLGYNLKDILAASQEGVALLDRSWISDIVYRAPELQKMFEASLDHMRDLMGVGYVTPAMGMVGVAKEASLQFAVDYTLNMVRTVFPQLFEEDLMYIFLDVDAETSVSREEDPARFSEPETIRAVNATYRYVFSPDNVEAQMGGRIVKFFTGNNENLPEETEGFIIPDGPQRLAETVWDFISRGLQDSPNA